MAKIASEAQWKALANLINSKQETLVAGTNIQITGKTISATDTKYTAGTGLTLVENAFSIDTSKVAQKSDLTGFLASDALSGYATTESVTSAIASATSDMATKTELAAQLTAVYRYKGSLENKAALDEKTEGNTTGDVWNVEDTGDNYAWDGTGWDKLAGTVDLSGYAKTSDLAEYATTDSLSEYAKTTDMNSAIQTATEDMATKSYVSEQLSSVQTVIEFTDEEWQKFGFTSAEGV